MEKTLTKTTVCNDSTFNPSKNGKENKDPTIDIQRDK